jgi:hypothetical protein
MMMRNEKDNSSELRTGDIKKILIQFANEIVDDFEFLTYKNYIYAFQRIRKINALSVYEMLRIGFTLKHGSFDCSISSSLNPEYRFHNSYNIGLINPHINLKALRNNSGILNFEDAYYFHNGRVETATKTVNQIFSDFKSHGLPFLEKQFKRLQNSNIITTGLSFIDALKTDKNKLKSDVEDELKNSRHLISCITNPLYVDLKGTLQKVAGQTRDDRKQIPKAAYELLELYWSR